MLPEHYVSTQAASSPKSGKGTQTPQVTVCLLPLRQALIVSQIQGIGSS